MDVGQSGGDVGEFIASQVRVEGTTSLLRLGYRRDDFNWLIVNYEYLLIPHV